MPNRKYSWDGDEQRLLLIENNACRSRAPPKDCHDSQKGACPVPSDQNHPRPRGEEGTLPGEGALPTTLPRGKKGAVPSQSTGSRKGSSP